MNIARRPRVNLQGTSGLPNTLRTCPLAGVVALCAPTVCARFRSSQVPVGWEKGENKWSSSWGLVLLLLILVSFLLVSSWINIRRGHRHSGQRPSCSVVQFPSRGRARWVGGRRWRLSRRLQSSKRVSFSFPLFFIDGGENFFFKGKVSCISSLLDMLVAKREPTPCYNDAYSVGTPKWASSGERLAKAL